MPSVSVVLALFIVREWGSIRERGKDQEKRTLYSQAERSMPKGSESSLGYKARACLKRKGERKYQEAGLKQPHSRASKSAPPRAGPRKAMRMRAFFPGPDSRALAGQGKFP